MKSIGHYLLFILAFSVFSGQLRAQQTDFEVWLKAGIKYEVSDRWDLSLEEQIRFDDDANALKNYHTELELKFMVNKLLDLILATRYITRNDNQGNRQGFEDHFRYQLGLGLKHDLGPFEMKYRMLYQDRNEIGLPEDEGDVSRRYFRLRSGFTYKIKDWKYDPELNVEYFGAMNKTEAGIENSIRFTIGTERNYKKIGEFGIYYRYETTLGTIIDEITHVLALKYTYTIKQNEYEFQLRWAEPTRHSPFNSSHMNLVKRTRFFLLLLLLVSPLPTGCSYKDTSRLDSDNYSTATARVKALENEIIAPTDFTDAAFELFNVNGFSNSRISVPGASSWDYRFAVKIAQADIAKWTQEMTTMTELNIDLEWTKQITQRENAKWLTKSQPEYFKRSEEDVFIIVYRNEGIVFKRIIGH